jgi:hypothetical protein
MEADGSNPSKGPRGVKHLQVGYQPPQESDRELVEKINEILGGRAEFKGSIVLPPDWESHLTQSLAPVEGLMVALLDGWAAILPMRVVNEDLGDYIEDIRRRARKGQRWQLCLRAISGLAWTGVNAAGYVLETLFRKRNVPPKDTLS